MERRALTAGPQGPDVQPKIFIIIVHRNSLEDTSRCLDALSRVDYPRREIVIVDNGSTDGSKEILRELHPRLALLEHREDHGLAGGYNTGIRYALRYGGEDGLLLRHDTVVDPQILKAFVAAAGRYHDAGIFGAKVYCQSDRRRIWSARPHWDPEALCFRDPFAGLVEDEPARDPLSVPGEVDYADGSALFFRLSLVDKIGFLDERFFTGLEDVDWCCRARKAGVKVVFVPGARVWRKGDGSGSEDSSAVYFGTRNRFLWARKDLPLGQKPRFYLKLFRSVFPAVSSRRGDRFIDRITKDIYFLKSPRGRAVAGGCLDYFLGRFGNGPEHRHALPE